MSHRNMDIGSIFMLAVAAGADVLVNHALTIVSIVGVLIAAVCQLINTYIRWRESALNLSKLKTKHFREWERARENA